MMKKQILMKKDNQRLNLNFLMEKVKFIFNIQIFLKLLVMQAIDEVK